MADTTPPAPPYAVVARPGPGLATIADRRDGTTRLWSRSLRSGVVRGGAPRAPCANCGADLRRANFYKPPKTSASRDRLCLACVEGDGERHQERSTP